MKKILPLWLMLLLIMSLFSSCSEGKKEPSQSDSRTYADYINSGKRIAVQMGDVYGDVARDLFKASEATEYISVADMLESVRMGRTDAALLSHSYVKQLEDSGMYPEFKYLWVPTDIYVNEAAPIFHTEELRDKYNEWFEGIKADGTWQEIVDRWIGVPLPEQEDIPSFELTGENGTLKMCDTGNYPPLSYFDANGKPTGFDVEIMSRFAQHMGMKLEITMMAYEAIVPYVISGKADMSACTLTVTDEREEGIIMGLPSVITQAVLVVPKNTAESSERVLDYTDFFGKKIGVTIGSVSEMIAQDILNGTPAYYSERTAGMEDVRNGRIDGYMTDYSTSRIIAAENKEFVCAEIPAEVYSAPMGAISNNEDLIGKFNKFLSELKHDGTLAEMQNRWLENIPDLDAPMPDIKLTGENGTLKVATCGEKLPFSYIGANGVLKGYSIELITRFAASEGMNIEFADMEFSGMIPYVLSGKADMGIANISITDERKKSISFTDSIYEDTFAILALKSGGVVSGSSQLRYTDFKGKRMGVITGSICDQVTEEYIKGVPVYYTENSAGLEDLRKARLDGFMIDLSVARVIANSAENKDMEVVEVPKEVFFAPMGALSVDQSIIDRFNRFLEEIADNGTLAEMQNRWLDNVPDLDTAMPDIELTGENGVLTVATSGTNLPFSYFGANGELKGYSIEVIKRYAAHEGLSIEFFVVDFSGIIPAVTSGKADIGIDNVSITEERKKSVIFSDSIYDDQLGILTLKRDDGTRDYRDFFGKRFSVMVGSVFDEIADRIFNASEKLYFNNVIDEIHAVHLGKSDAALLDHVVAMVSLSGGGYDDLTTTEIPLDELNFRYSVFSDNQDVIDKYNEFLKTIKQNGTYDDMIDRWFSDYDPERQVPGIPLTNKNGTLKIAINASYPPFVYLGSNEKWSGFDIEQFYRFAAYLEMDVEFIDMEFSALLPYVISGKADIASSIYYTEERAQSVIFGDEVYSGKTVLVHKKDAAETNSKMGFIEWLKSGIKRNLLTDDRWKMIVDGLGVTMIISFAAQFFGTIFGSFVCYILTRKNRFVRWLGDFYCGLINGTPIIVLLMIAYYIIFGNKSMSSVLVAIAAFSMITGAGVAQKLKGAIETVDPVEIEAARSIGFSAFGTFLTVTLPQAVRRVLPAYTNGFVELVKATAIVGYIAIQDLTRAGDIIRSRTYDAYFPILFVALIYLIITTICVLLFKFIVKKINGEADGTRRRRRFGKAALDDDLVRKKAGEGLIAPSTSEARKGDGK